MNISLNNYNKPSHPLFKSIGDVCLFAIPLYISILTTLPISDTIKLWIMTGLSFVLATIKIISKFTIDPNYKDNDNKDTILTDSNT
jgi:hypothetical protein